MNTNPAPNRGTPVVVNPVDLEVTRLWLEGRRDEAAQLHTFQPSLRFIRSFKFDVVAIIASWNDGDIHFRGPLHALRDEYEGTNLFDGGMEWRGPDGFHRATLDSALDCMLPGEVWSCDNCRIEIVIDRQGA